MNQQSSDLVVMRQSDGSIIPHRMTDGYINATAMCEASGRKFATYRRSELAEEFLQELSKQLQRPIEATDGSVQYCTDPLIISVNTGRNELRGTWVHPQVAIHLGMWCSPKFAVAVVQWVHEWMETGKSPSAHESLYQSYARQHIFLPEPDKKWQKRFPDLVRDEICRIWSEKTEAGKRVPNKPGAWLRSVYRHIFYDRVFEDFAKEEIRRMSFVNGKFTYKYHQSIRHDNVGGMEFQFHMRALMNILPGCETKEQVVFFLDRIAPKRSDKQGKLMLLYQSEKSLN